MPENQPGSAENDRACDWCGKPAPEEAGLSIWWADYECCSMACAMLAEGEPVQTWEYEAEAHEDHGGADVYHHIVSGDRHIAEVETEADARLIVEAVNATLRVIPPGLREGGE
jgi:hypothetical protein